MLDLKKLPLLTNVYTMKRQISFRHETSMNILVCKAYKTYAITEPRLLLQLLPLQHSDYMV
jgi:hypothetical protein